MSNNYLFCQKCGGVLKRYDSVKRQIRKKGNEKGYIRIERFKCTKCNHVYRVLPDVVYPYKQYESEIIDGVREGIITSETLGFEDYPCEATMKRWLKELSENKD